MDVICFVMAESYTTKIQKAGDLSGDIIIKCYLNMV